MKKHLFAIFALLLLQMPLAAHAERFQAVSSVDVYFVLRTMQAGKHQHHPYVILCIGKSCDYCQKLHPMCDGFSYSGIT